MVYVIECGAHFRKEWGLKLEWAAGLWEDWAEWKAG